MRLKCFHSFNFCLVFFFRFAKGCNYIFVTDSYDATILLNPLIFISVHAVFLDGKLLFSNILCVAVTPVKIF